MVGSWAEWSRASPFLYVDTLNVIVNGRPGVVEHDLVEQSEPGVFVFPNNMLVKNFDSFYSDFFAGLKSDGLCQVLAGVQLPVLSPKNEPIKGLRHYRYFTPLIPGLPSASSYLERCAQEVHLNSRRDKDVDFGRVLHELWPALFPNSSGWYFR